MSQILVCINLQKSLEYEKSPQLLSHKVQRTLRLLRRVVILEDRISSRLSSLKDAEKETTEGASAVVRFWSSSGLRHEFHLIRSISKKQQTWRIGRRAQEESLSIFPKTRKDEHLLETTFPRPFFLSRILSFFRGRSFREYLRPENSHAFNRPEVHSFSETFAPSKIATTTILLDFCLQIAIATCFLDFRLQLRSLTSSTFVTSWTVMGWAEFLENPNNQAPIITVVTTTPYMKIVAVTPISPVFHSPPG